ncbi:MAG: ATP-binding protein [Bryobacteraceae bacterium]
MDTSPTHSLLRRQLKRNGVDWANLGEPLARLLASVDEAYRQADDDRKMLERSLELSSRELHEANRDMRLAKEAAERASQAKGDFLANMSHEIRTPMNAIIGLTGVLIDSVADPAHRDLLETIRTAGDSLLEIINDILDFSRIDANRLQIEERELDVRTCVAESLEIFAFKAAEKGLELVNGMDPSVPVTVRTDGTRLRQILLNVVGNAVKFTAKGEVVLRTSAAQSPGGLWELRFEVRDTGIGIPAERMDRLFQPFSQVDESTTRRFGGTGLGLVISKRLCELMGGRMWADSREGEGSRFLFTISAPAGSAPPLAIPDLRGKRVLVAAANAEVRRILAEALAPTGAASVHAASSSEASAVVASGQCDAVVSEAGWAGSLGGSAPVIALTASAKDAVPRHARASLPKPVRVCSLLDALARLLNPNARAAECRPQAPVIDPGLAKRNPLRILVAEDNRVNQKVLLRMLDKFGYQADLASTGLEALDMAVRNPYDLVLMDVHMPDMDGLNATRELRRRLASKRPRIVAMTASALEEDRKRCLEAGMDGFVSKPFRVADLDAVLRADQPV